MTTFRRLLPVFVVAVGLTAVVALLSSSRPAAAGYRPNWWGHDAGPWRTYSVDDANLPFVLRAIELRGETPRFVLPSVTTAVRDCSAFGCTAGPGPVVCNDPVSIESCPLVSTVVGYTVVSRENVQP